jgi:cobalt-zinc-cadmium efflux system membrane fusion protein
MFWKSAIALVAFAGVGGAVYVSGVTKAYVKGALKNAEHILIPAKASAAKEVSVTVDTIRLWDKDITLTPEEERSIGLRMTTVAAQTEPIKLELTGRTAYDPDTLTKIRPRFDTLVEKVHASLGQTVKRGEPLVELHSTELAAAKSDFQGKYVQWQHDLKLFNLRQDLVKTGAISKQLWVDTINDEEKSRLEYTLARDRLKIIKVPDAEIEPLLAPLRDVDTRVTAQPQRIPVRQNREQGQDDARLAGRRDRDRA